MTTVVSRDFLQERLAFFGRAGFLFCTAFLAVFNLAEILEPRHVWTQWVLANRSNQFHLGLCLVFLAVWLLCRGAPRARRALGVIDAAGLWLTGLACILPAWWADASGHRMYAMFIEVTQLVVLRAVVVPSTPRRTFWSSAALVPPATFTAWSFHHARSADLSTVVKPTLEAALFCSMAVVLATLASRVIYGLRQEVRAARQLGQYTLQEKLGEGGMGIVYRAQHAMLRRPTAVKLLPPERAGEASIRRFEREVQLTSRLTHPNTVSIYDYGRTPDGIFYYAMELLDGLTLAQVVAADGPQPAGRVVHILAQVCDALAEAHAVGLVHRDIKPANVMLCERWGAADVVKVVDFGLVRDLGQTFDSQHSIENMVTGTPQYISPEAIRVPGEVGPAADIYAVGGVGYFLLTGHPVFEGGSLVEILSQHLDRRPIPPSERLGRVVPTGLEALIMACLEKDPGQRPARAEALATALRGCLDANAWTPADARDWWRRRHEGGPGSRDTSPALGLTDAPSNLEGDGLLRPRRDAP